MTEWENVDEAARWNYRPAEPVALNPLFSWPAEAAGDTAMVFRHVAAAVHRDAHRGVGGADLVASAAAAGQHGELALELDG